MPRTKKVLSPEVPFLKTAATAIGTALGKLAVKTGVATPLAKSTKKSPPKKTGALKASPIKKVAKRSKRG